MASVFRPGHIIRIDDTKCAISTMDKRAGQLILKSARSPSVERTGSSHFASGARSETGKLVRTAVSGLSRAWFQAGKVGVGAADPMESLGLITVARGARVIYDADKKYLLLVLTRYQEKRYISLHIRITNELKGIDR